MAATTFPKSYLLERIDARLASMERKDEADTATVVRAEAERQVRALQWLEGVRDRAERVRMMADAHLVRVANMPAGDHGAEFVKGAEDVEPLARKVADASWNATGYDTPERDTAYAGQEAARALDVRRRERDSLTHARAYLVDTPVDEFTTATLRTLGLLEVVKFDLDYARQEAAAAAKRRGR